MKILAVLVGAIFVLMVAAVLIPCLYSSSATAYESSAAARTRTLATAEIQYKATYGHYADIKALAGDENCAKPTSDNACLIDRSVANSSPANSRNGYYFVAQTGPTTGTFLVAAIPVKLPHKGFCATEDGVVRSDKRSSGSGAISYTECKSLSPLGGYREKS